MKRANVTVSRNDVRPDGFKRWTVEAHSDENENPPEGWEECGSCGCWHPGDGKAYECRDDANRWPFATHA